MTLTLYFHPLSSFCQKVLIALYENDTPFEPKVVNLGDRGGRCGPSRRLWPIGKFPVFWMRRTNQTVPELSIIIEYLDRHYPGKDAAHPGERTILRAEGASVGPLL